VSRSSGAGYDHVKFGELAPQLLSKSAVVSIPAKLQGVQFPVSLHELESAKLRFCISAPRTALEPKMPYQPWSFAAVIVAVLAAAKPALPLIPDIRFLYTRRSET
jgi:hypothetical protein